MQLNKIQITIFNFIALLHVEKISTLLLFHETQRCPASDSEITRYRYKYKPYNKYSSITLRDILPIKLYNK